MTDMLRRGIKLIGIMLQHEAEIHNGQRQRMVNIQQIATELHEREMSDAWVNNSNFMEMAGALDLNQLLQPFGETYAPYFSQPEDYTEMR